MQLGSQMHSNCIRVTASRMQIVLAWLPVTGKFPSILFKLQETAATLVQLQATDGHSSTICLQLAANWEQFECNWQPVQCKTTSFLKARCQNNYLNQKIRKLLKNLRTYETYISLGLSIKTMHVLIQSRETIPLNSANCGINYTFKLFI